jgi:hypothetical protein
LAAVEQYWTADLRRDELLDVLQRKGEGIIAPANEPINVSPSRGKITAIWRSRLSSERTLLPQVIVGESRDLDDLWAWAFSYLRGLGPLTAQTRVLTPQEYRSALKRRHVENWWRFIGGFIGMILGEAIVQTAHAQAGEDIGLAACRSTLSFVLTRASALGLNSQELFDIGSTWEKLRIQTGQSITAIAANEISLVAASLSGATISRAFPRASEGRVVEWLFHLLDNGPDELLRELNGAVVGQGESDLRKLLRGTAEDRVQFFDQSLPSLIDHSSFDRTERSFVIALFAFISRPGLSAQMSLLSTVMRIYPDALLWLGAMQALYSPEETLAYGEGLGWRIARDVSEGEDIFSVPRCDISFSELQLLLRNRTLQRTIRFLPRTRLDVELAPAISTWIRGFSADRSIQSELPLDTRPAERDAAELSAKSVRDVERSLETALKIIRAIQMPTNTSSASPRRKSRR